MRKISKKIITILCLLFLTVFAMESILPENYSIITVAEAAIKTRINKKKATILVGDKLKLEMKGTDEKVKWYTSDSSIATVSKKGYVKGIAPGRATITAKIGKKKYKCKVTVEAALSVDQTVITLEENQSTKITATYKGRYYLKWINSDSNVATCKWNEEARTSYTHELAITARKAGNAIITITDSHKDSIQIQVVVTPSTKWTKDRVNTMLDKMTPTLRCMESSMDHMNLYLKYGRSSDLQDAAKTFVAAASGIKDCRDYAATLDPVVSTTGRTLVSWLDEAYEVYTSFDLSTATSLTLAKAIMDMSNKFITASNLFLSFSKQYL